LTAVALSVAWNSSIGWAKTVSDTTPPVVKVPGPITTNATGPAGATVVYTATATDDLDPHPSLVCKPPSGSVFPIGDTKVICTATDFSKNSASASFTVHVKGAPEQIGDLMTVVNTLGPPVIPQLKTLLHTFLQRGLAAAQAGDAKTAAYYVSTFIKTVGDLARPPRPQITQGQANQLLTPAAQIKKVLGY
jgi:hypothetical protein